MQRAFPLALAVLAVTCAAANAQSPATPAERAHAVHVLNRLAFGPRPGDVDRVLAVGVDRWIEQQLNPDRRDVPPEVPLASCEVWDAPIADVPTVQHMISIMTNQDGAMLSGRLGLSGGFTLDRPASGASTSIFLLNRRMVACRVMRAERSDYQLLEVMTDFWSNHFSIFSGALPSRNTLAMYDRASVRPNALGRFRDLLGAVAHDPAMLTYLNNDVSGALDGERTLAEYVEGLRAGMIPHNGLNENFGRELMELHTLGVDGGYTEMDVINVARAFSGWTHSGLKYGCVEALLPDQTRMTCRERLLNAPAFRFDSTKHDAGTKVILGRILPPGRGLQDGDDVLDMLARHPSTARFIARKLAVRFISDAPPQSIVDRAAETFLRTDGNIRAVLHTIIDSDEFGSAQHAKVKTPLEFVLSVRRALNAPYDHDGYAVDALMDMDQPPYGHRSPEGWPETGSAWLSTSSVLARINYAHAVAHDSVPSISVKTWPAWQLLKSEPYTKQADGVIATLLHGRASPELRAALLAAEPAHPEPESAAAREEGLRKVLALVLGSPDFQRR